MSRVRRLDDAEAALWARVAATVAPLPGRKPPVAAPDNTAPSPISAKAKPRPAAIPSHAPRSHRPAAAPQPKRDDIARQGLDSTWDRKLARGTIAPDFTLDLHGCTLDAAHARLDHGLAQAILHGARVMLLITGKHRPSDDHAGRAERRGAIRSKFLDWIAAGPHASQIAAIRPAHPRHGGGGAVYVVLKRAR